MALNAAGEFKAILVSTTPPYQRDIWGKMSPNSPVQYRRAQRGGGGSLVLHFFQNWHNHVKLGPLCRVLVHADLHEFANVGRDAGWDGGPQTLQGDLRATTEEKIRVMVCFVGNLMS